MSVPGPRRESNAQKDWLEGAVRQVLHQLAQKDAANPRDVHVWSDGSVTGPRENDARSVSELRLVAVFSPDESPSEDAVRETLENGMREAESAEDDAEAAVTAGTLPAVLPGTASPSTSQDMSQPTGNGPEKEAQSDR